ncbi:MAG: hypothetical protein FWG16_04990, partial [Micrococcales bacterium]|nr:hypothetical protein [Micrococcales bacterium]
MTDMAGFAATSSGPIVPRAVKAGLVAPDAVLRSGELIALGVSEGELRGPGFLQLLRGVYCPVTHPEIGSFALQVRAAVASINGAAL